MSAEAPRVGMSGTATVYAPNSKPFDFSVGCCSTDAPWLSISNSANIAPVLSQNPVPMGCVRRIAIRVGDRGDHMEEIQSTLKQFLIKGCFGSPIINRVVGCWPMNSADSSRLIPRRPLYTVEACNERSQDCRHYPTINTTHTPYPAHSGHKIVLVHALRQREHLSSKSKR